MPSDSSTALALLFAAGLLLLPRAFLPRLDRSPDLTGILPFLWWVNFLYCKLLYRLEANGPAPLPRVGPALLVSNHTCGADHMLLQARTDRLLGFLVAQEYYEHRIGHFFASRMRCIPVKRDGRDVSATRAAIRALKEGRVVPIFPEGKIHPNSGEDFLPGRPGAAFLATQLDVPVIPAYIRGTPRTNDVYKVLWTPGHARVTFGPPIDLSAYRNQKRPDLEAVTEEMMAAIRRLKERGERERQATALRNSPADRPWLPR